MRLRSLLRLVTRPFAWSANALFGYDFFISYSWNDPDRLGRNYAVALKNRLTDKGYTCFLDSTDYEKGADWREIGQLALRRTRKLLLVATPAIFGSKPVLREVRLFRRTGRDIIPIDIAGTLVNATPSHALTEFIPNTRLRITEPDLNPVGGPADQVLKEISHSFGLTRQRTIRRRVVVAVMVALAGLTGWAEVQRREAEAQRTEAETQRTEAVTQQGQAVKYGKEAEQKAEEARTNLARAEEELLRANTNLARAHHQKAKALLESAPTSVSDRDWQRILLHALEAQRQSLGNRDALPLDLRSSLIAPFPINAFARRWYSPTASSGRPIEALLLSPPGDRVVTGGKDGALSIWDVATGSLRMRVDGHQGAVTCLTESAELGLVASGDDQGVIRIWSPQSGALRQLISGNGGPVSAIAFAPQGRRIAVGNRSGRVRLVDWDAQKELWQLDALYESSVHDLKFNRDGTKLWVARGMMGPTCIRMLDAASGTVLWERNPGDEVSGMALSLDETELYGLLSVSGVHRLRADTGEHLGELGDDSVEDASQFDDDCEDPSELGDDSGEDSSEPGNNSGEHLGGFGDDGIGVNSIALNQSTGALVVGTSFGVIRVLDPNTGTELGRARRHGDAVTSLALSVDGRLASASLDGSVQISDVPSSISSAAGVGQTGILDLAVSSGSRLIAAGSDGGGISVWDLDRGTLLRELSHPQPEVVDLLGVTAVAFNSDGDMLATGDSRGGILLWDPKTGDNIAQMMDTDVCGSVHSIAFSPDGKKLAVGCDVGVVIYSVRSKRRLQTLPAGGVHPVVAIAFSEDGSSVTGASHGDPGDHWVRRWNLKTGKTLRTYRVKGDVIVSMALGSEGKRWVVGESGGRVMIGDRARGEDAVTLKDEGGSVESVALNQGGSLAAVGLYGGSVEIWDAEKRTKRLDTVTGCGQVTTMEFDADSKVLVIGCQNGSVQLIEVPPSIRGFGRRTDTPFLSLDVTPDDALLAGVLEVYPQEGLEPQWELLTWNLLDGRETKVGASGVPLLTVRLSPSGGRLAAVGEDGNLSLWPMQPGARSHLIDAKVSGGAVAFAPGGKTIFTGTKDGIIRRWGSASGLEENPFVTLDSEIAVLAFDPQGEALAVGMDNGGTAVFDLDSGLRFDQPDQSLRPSRVTGMALGPQAEQLAVGYLDGSITHQFLSPASAPLLFSGHAGPVTGVEIHPTGELVASSSSDGTIRLWDARLGTELVRLTEGIELKMPLAEASTWIPPEVFEIRFLRGGAWLASASGALDEGGFGALRLWDLRTFLLINNGAAPSPRAALISEALQRIWGLRLSGLDIEDRPWHRLTPRNGYYIDQEVVIDVRPASATADRDSKPTLRTFDIRPLLDPPPPGKDKLDQLLDWLAEQEPRLKP